MPGKVEEKEGGKLHATVSKPKGGEERAADKKAMIGAGGESGAAGGAAAPVNNSAAGKTYPVSIDVA